MDAARLLERLDHQGLTLFAQGVRLIVRPGNLLTAIHTRDVAPSGYPAPDCFEKEKTAPDGCRINGVSGNQEQVDPVAGCRMKNHPARSGTEKSHTNHGGAGLPDEPDTSIYPPKTKSDDSDDCKVF